MSQDLPQFEDPELQAALKRTVGQERAGDELRQRILAIAAEARTASDEPDAAQPAVSPPRTIRLHQRPAVRVAAALLLALIGVAAILLYRAPTTARLPRPFLLALAQRHDLCCQAPDHHEPDLPQSDFHQMARTMGSKLDIRVLTFDLADQGWTFKGAALCPIDGQRTGHLLFAGADGHMSIFSVPAAIAQGARDGNVIVNHTKGHEIAAFVRDGVVYALVHKGNKPLPDAEMRKLLREHREQIVAAAIAMGVVPRPPHPLR